MITGGTAVIGLGWVRNKFVAFPYDLVAKPSRYITTLSNRLAPSVFGALMVEGFNTLVMLAFVELVCLRVLFQSGHLCQPGLV